jgi:hypothetical protein
LAAPATKKASQLSRVTTVDRQCIQFLLEFLPGVWRKEIQAAIKSLCDNKFPSEIFAEFSRDDQPAFGVQCMIVFTHEHHHLACFHGKWRKSDQAFPLFSGLNTANTLDSLGIPTTH